MQTVNEELREFVVNNFLFGKDDQELSDGDSFLGKGIIDSTGVLELVTFLEEQYNIQVNDDEFIPENLDSIHALAGFLERKLPASSAKE